MNGTSGPADRPMADAPTSPDRPSVADLPPLRAVIRDHDLAARKQLGQNFLLDLNLTRRIARAAGDLTDVSVLEVGPGPGGLTRALVESPARRVLAVERDRRAIAALAGLQAAAGDRLTVLEGDALALDAIALLDPPRAVVANLPYNIATPLLIGWLRQAPAFRGLTLMFQREVADRLVAPVGDAAYGRLSVIAQATTRPAIALTVPPQAFTPPPKVSSAVVHFTPKPALPPGLLPALERLTQAGFGQRRKTLRRSLSGIPNSAAYCEQAGIDPGDRAERVPVAAWCAMAAMLADAG